MKEPFSDSVYRVVSTIPPGRVMSYSMVAGLAGNPSASRAVGTLMSRNPRPGTGPGKVPCHRVVRSDGSPGGFTSPDGPAKKIRMLEAEGITFSSGKINRKHFL